MGHNRTELLRTQAVHAILGTLGASQVNVYGNDSATGTGVYLHDDRTLSSITYWVEADGKRYEYDVRVSVDVYRREVSHG